MKILTLLEIIQTDISSKKYNGSLRYRPVLRGHTGYNKNITKKELDKGSHASVKRHPTDPHMVKRHNYNPYDLVGDEFTPADEIDGFNGYIRYLIDEKLMGTNPAFPRVYNIKEIKGKNDKVIYTYEIEKLIPATELRKDEWEAICDKLIAEDFNEDNYGFDEFMAIQIGCAINGGNYSAFKDEEFIKALKELHHYSNEFDKPSDMTTRNFMFRRTPYGLDLVITDPFY